MARHTTQQQFWVVELDSRDFVQYSAILFPIFHLPLPVRYTSLSEVELCFYAVCSVSHDTVPFK
jgi:hypothetical protein